MKRVLLLIMLCVPVTSVMGKTFPYFSEWLAVTNNAAVLWQITKDNQVDSYSLYDRSDTNDVKRYHVHVLRDSSEQYYLTIVLSTTNTARMQTYKVTHWTNEKFRLELLFKYHPPVVWHKPTPFQWTPVIMVFNKTK